MQSLHATDRSKPPPQPPPASVPNPNPNPNPNSSVGYGESSKPKGLAAHGNDSNASIRKQDTFGAYPPYYGYWPYWSQSYPSYYMAYPYSYNTSEQSYNLENDCYTIPGASIYVDCNTSGTNISSKDHRGSAEYPMNGFNGSMPIQSPLGMQMPNYQSDLNSQEFTNAFGSNSSYASGTVPTYVKEPSYDISMPIQSLTASMQQKLENVCEQTEAREDKKEAIEEESNQRGLLEQVEMADNGVQGSSSGNPYDVLMAKDATLISILEALRYLSDILMSSNFDISDFEQHDHELIHLLVCNLKAFITKTKMDVTSSSSHDSLMKAPHSLPISGLKNDFISNENSSSCDTEEKVHSVASNMNNDEPDFAENNSSSDLDSNENFAQDIEKLLQDKFSNDEESLQARVYKKLWICAQAALCSLKYELELTRLKIKEENHDHQKIGKSQQLSNGSTLNNTHKYESLLMGKNSNKKKFTAPFMDRLEALTRRDEKATKPQITNVSDSVLDGHDIETEAKTREFDASVMARLKVLKSRDDNSKKPEVTNLSDSGAKAFSIYSNASGPIARLDVLKGRDGLTKKHAGLRDATSFSNEISDIVSIAQKLEKQMQQKLNGERNSIDQKTLYFTGRALESEDIMGFEFV